jgi:Polyketide cyclase / dehydrase and lipid transport
MRTQFSKIAAGCGLAMIFLANFAGAQAPAPRGQAAPAAGSSAVANPTYITIPLEIAVNKPAADVWKRVGKYCDIGEWLQVNCTIVSGKDGEVGAVRSIGTEVLVGKTDLSYTYTQPVRDGRPYNLYHGTLEVKPVTATTSKIVYTLMYDNSMLADDAAREADKTQKTTTFTRAIENMKVLAEGGTLPPAPARGGGAGRGAGAPGGGAPAGGGQPGGAPRGQRQ